MTTKITSVAVFAGSSYGKRNEYADAASALGAAIAGRSLTLVYGGGYRGLMGIVAESVLTLGGKVIGVLPEALNNEKVRLKDVETELIIVPDMHERKSRMYALSDAFIALPGGIGTIEELSEIYTWKQLGIHEKNIGLLNTEGYWDPFIAQIERGRDEGFISREVLDALIVEKDPERLLDRLACEVHALPDKL